MKAEITIEYTFSIKIDGKPVNGNYKVAGEWEGMVKLNCDGPCGSLIIQRPEIPSANRYDLVPKMLGGNAENGKSITFKAEVVRADCGHIGTAATAEFKRPS